MPSKTKNKKLRQWFKIQKWKWYVVDTSDWHRPILVRKHLDTEQQAKIFRDKYYPTFDVIYYKKAIEYYEKDLQSSLKHFGADHPNVALTWNNLGNAWRELGNHTKAVKYYEKALKVFKKSFGKNHVYTKTVSKNLKILRLLIKMNQ